MNRERSSKGKDKVQKATYIKAGSVRELANKRKSLLLSHHSDQASSRRPTVERLSSLICEHPNVGDVHAHTEQVGAHTHHPSTSSLRSEDEQVQQDSTTHTSNEQCEEQGNTMKRKRGRTHTEQVGAHTHRPSTSSPPTEDEQVQQDSTTHTSNEQCEEQGNAMKRKRGRTLMLSVHAQTERKRIVLNYLDQPVAPKKVVSELGHFLGTLGRNPTLCPLEISTWRKMETDDLWKYTKEKYDIPEAGKKWVLEGIKNAWRNYKYRLKQDHFLKYENDEMRMQNRPKDISEPVFKELLKYWNSDKAKKSSKTNIENRKKLKNPHTVGKTSFAIFRSELEKEKEGDDPLTLREVFEKTRARKPGRSYKVSNEDTIAKLTEMEQIETQQSDDEDEHVSAFTTVMGPEHPGRVRLYGRAVTKTSLKGKMGHFEPSSSASNGQAKNMEERMLSMEEKLEEQRTIMRQELEQEMEEKLEEQRTTMRQEIEQEVLAKVFAELRQNSIEIVHKATPQENTQQIHRPSIGSNNRGELLGREMDEGGDDDSLDLT